MIIALNMAWSLQVAGVSRHASRLSIIEFSLVGVASGILVRSVMFYICLIGFKCSHHIRQLNTYKLVKCS